MPRALLPLLLLQCSAYFLSAEAALRANAPKNRNTLTRELEDELNEMYPVEPAGGMILEEPLEGGYPQEPEGVGENGGGMEETPVTEPAAENNEEESTSAQGAKIELEKSVFSPDEPIKVSFESGGVDASGWTIGIYMHMANPQDGALPPIAAMSACPSGTACTEGVVEFHDPSLITFGDEDYIEQWGAWPLYPQFAYDVQLLDENGSAKVYPVPMFAFEQEDEEDY